MEVGDLERHEGAEVISMKNLNLIVHMKPSMLNDVGVCQFIPNTRTGEYVHYL